MTTALYYDDPMATDFTSVVDSVGDDRRAVTLRATLFYPEGGGQPADRGWIGNVPVVDTQKSDDGTITHTLAEPAPHGFEAGAQLPARIDWAHRWEYMQQHTGQHVLSGALLDVAHAPTVAVHQGTDVTTIEVDVPELSQEMIAAVEARANQVVRDNLPVRGFWIDDSQLPNYTLRRPTGRRGRIRLVEIEQFDLVACGGVHLPRTGLLNLVHTVGSERIRGRLRLAFAIGDRALADYAKKDAAAQRTGALFSSQPEQIAERAWKLTEDLKAAHAQLKRSARRIAGLTLDGATVDDGAASVRFDHEDSDTVNAVCEQAAGRAAHPVSITNLSDAGVQWALVLPGSEASEISELREFVLNPLGAKGGGKPPVLRGIIKDAGAEAAERLHAAFADAIRRIRPQQ